MYKVEYDGLSIEVLNSLVYYKRCSILCQGAQKLSPIYVSRNK